MTKIGVAGLDHAGLSTAILPAQRNDVAADEISRDRVDQVNDRQCPIINAERADLPAYKQLRPCATTDPAIVFKAGADLIVANRLHDEIRTVEARVFARDLFGSDA